MAVSEYPRNDVMLFPPGKKGSPNLEDLKYPRLFSIKYDGSYCLIYSGELFTRRLKLHPNNLLRERFKSLLDLSREGHVFMGELYDPSGKFRESQSIIRSHAKDLGELSLYIFDYMPKFQFDRKDQGLPFEARYKLYEGLIHKLDDPYVHAVSQTLVTNLAEALEFYRHAIEFGYEGAVSRSCYGYYKYGRCTESEGFLFRHRRYQRDEAIILDVNAGLSRKDSAPRVRTASGKADRTFKRDDYETSNIAGSVRVRLSGGAECNVGFGRGWSHSDRLLLLANKRDVYGKVAEIEFNPDGHDTEKGLPRQPKLIRIRTDKTALD